MLYLVHITLAALLLDGGWTWGLTVLSVLCYGSLFLSDAHAGHALADIDQQHPPQDAAVGRPAGVEVVLIVAAHSSPLRSRAQQDTFNDPYWKPCSKYRVKLPLRSRFVQAPAPGPLATLPATNGGCDGLV